MIVLDLKYINSVVNLGSWLSVIQCVFVVIGFLGLLSTIFSIKCLCYQFTYCLVDDTNSHVHMLGLGSER